MCIRDRAHAALTRLGCNAKEEREQDLTGRKMKRDAQGTAGMIAAASKAAAHFNTVALAVPAATSTPPASTANKCSINHCQSVQPSQMPYPPKPAGKWWDLHTWHIFIDVMRRMRMHRHMGRVDPYGPQTGRPAVCRFSAVVHVTDDFCTPRTLRPPATLTTRSSDGMRPGDREQRL